jgi:hypothetical protein
MVNDNPVNSSLCPCPRPPASIAQCRFLVASHVNVFSKKDLHINADTGSFLECFQESHVEMYMALAVP